MPAVWRRDHLLGARRDRQGARRDPRWRRPGDRDGQAGGGACRGGRTRLVAGAVAAADRRPGGGPGAGRAEAFAAWRTFLAASRRTGPAVVVFEDLHWADDACLDFVAELGAGLSEVPLLVSPPPARSCSAAPAPRTRWAGPSGSTSRRSPTRTLRDRRQPARGPVLPELRGPIVERAEGNPLFAEEYVRLLTDRGLLVTSDGSIAIAEGHRCRSRTRSAYSSRHAWTRSPRPQGRPRRRVGRRPGLLGGHGGGHE